MRRLILLLIVGSGLAAAIAGCGSDVDRDSDRGSDRDSSEVRVVASTALIAEFASVVVGDDAVVVGLIPAGVDLHSFEPAPGIVASIAQADLVLVNGHGLEGTLLKVIEQNVSGGVRVVAVSDGIDELLGSEGAIDPHLWLDVRNAMQYVETIRDALIDVSPEFESGYRERAAVYLAELGELHEELVGWFDTMGGRGQQLVVFHDAYGYLAAAYGFELLAAVVPAGGLQDPAAGRVAELIELVRQSGVRVVFAELQFNSTVLDRIAEEAGVQVRPLYSTYAGEVDSYVELMRANAESLGLGAGMIR